MWQRFSGHSARPHRRFTPCTSNWTLYSLASKPCRNPRQTGRLAAKEIAQTAQLPNASRATANSRMVVAPPSQALDAPNLLAAATMVGFLYAVKIVSTIERQQTAWSPFWRDAEAGREPIFEGWSCLAHS